MTPRRRADGQPRPPCSAAADILFAERGIETLRYHLGALLDSMGRWGDAVLVHDRAETRVRQLATNLPVALGDAVCLECRLGLDAPSEVDVSVRVRRSGGAIIAGQNPVIRLSDDRFSGPAWAATRALCRAWSTTGTCAHACIDHVWLEFDLGDAVDPDRVPSPSVFLALTPAARRQPAGLVSTIVATLLDPLLPNGLQPQTLERVLDCVERLPRDVEVHYLGVMLARGADRVRLYPGWLPGFEWAPYLRTIGADALAPVVGDAVDRYGGQIGLGHVDVGADGIADRMGLEYSLERGPQLRGRIAETALLDALVASALCTAERRQALDRWPSRRVVALPSHVLPTVVVRRVNDLKLVVTADGIREAKAYLTTWNTGAPH